MCNYCECDMAHLCSKVGYMSYGSCCEKCVHFTEDHTCPNFVIPMPKIKVEELTEFDLLPENFYLEGVKSYEKALEYYP